MVLAISAAFAASSDGAACVGESDNGGRLGNLGTEKQVESAGYVTLQYAGREPTSESMSDYYIFDACSADKKKILERKCENGKLVTEELSCFGNCVETSTRVFGLRGKALFWKSKVARCTAGKLENSFRNTYSVKWGYRQDPVTNTVIVTANGLPPSTEASSYLVYTTSDGKVINKIRFDSTTVILGKKWALQKNKEYGLYFEFVDKKGNVVTDFISVVPAKYTFRSMVGTRGAEDLKSLRSVTGNTFFNTVNGRIFWKR